MTLPGNPKPIKKRHFLSKKSILRTIDGMQYNKLNTLHWHITDSETFPILLETLPDIGIYGSYSKNSIYTISDFKEIINYALKRGVKIIPEIDSPGHSYSWSLSPNLQKISLLCDGKFNGQLDPSLP